jgi:NADH dehydrogenase (ubiquinone) 1 alpha subcomplex subunit 9
MLQAFAMPREILLKKFPFPLPNPEIFNLDQILAQAPDTLVSENGKIMFRMSLVVPSFHVFVII